MNMGAKPSKRVGDSIDRHADSSLLGAVLGARRRTESAIGEGTAAALSRPRVLTVVPGAGFTFETGCLLRRLEGFDLTYLRTSYGGEPGKDGLPPGEWFPVRPFATLTKPSHLENLLAFIDAFFATLRILGARKVDLVLAVGTPHGVPMLLAGRLCNVRTVFVESITRVDRLSAVGRLVLRLRLASRLFVQWPALQALHPRSELGIIL